MWCCYFRYLLITISKQFVWSVYDFFINNIISFNGMKYWYVRIKIKVIISK